MNINTEHIIHNSDCSLWDHSSGVYICDCGALMQARYDCSDDLTDVEHEMIVLHEVQIDQLRDDLPAKDEVPEDNIYTTSIPLIDFIRRHKKPDVSKELFHFYREYQLNDDKE